MFTGIIEEVGESSKQPVATCESAPPHPDDAKLGDSIAINGVDLTATAIDGDSFCADVMPETYRRPTSRAQPGRHRQFGAFGATHGSAQRPHRARRRRRHGDHRVLRTRSDAIIARFVHPPAVALYDRQSPVAIDGASLRSSTRRRTASPFRWCSTSGAHQPTAQATGASVNIEDDILARYLMSCWQVGGKQTNSMTRGSGTGGSGLGRGFG